MMAKLRDLALFNLAIDGKLRACDLISMHVSDVCYGGRVRRRAQIIQKKTKQAVEFEIIGKTRAAQILVGHTNLESTVRYLGVAVDDALVISENMDI